MTSEIWPTRYWINWGESDGRTYPKSLVVASEFDCPDLINDFKELIMRDFGDSYNEIMQLPRKRLPENLSGLWKLW